MSSDQPRSNQDGFDQQTFLGIKQHLIQTRCDESDDWGKRPFYVASVHLTIFLALGARAVSDIEHGT